MKLLVLLAVVCAASATTPRWPRLPEGWAPPDTKIVGGENADITEYPHQVAMYFGGSFRCGGSIIGPHTILTAAHCVSGLENYPSSFYIKHGVTDIRNNGNTPGVRKIHTHGSYGDYNGMDNDVATMILSSTISYSETASPIGLAGTNSGSYAGEDAMVSGWGSVREGGYISNILQAVQVPVITNALCKKQYGSSSITDDMLCAGYPEGGKDACQGDSGGPMISKNGGQQIGVVSWGRGCARPGYAGVYARVSTFYEWITLHMN
ncbi:PREDICTED: trypsin-7-like [Priapulus caudatus]|uniref:Trypsin-7-like n=1 Tax=Priapulus caudatus TaxID=37621 RepID=A0ABM1EC76_PRICU|nr:PREDICTED: trypsin-7-like [Priapulus caudatus]